MLARSGMSQLVIDLARESIDPKAAYKLSLLSGELLATAAEIRGNPRFEEAVRVFARHYVETFRGNLLLNKIATEEARHFLCGHVVALHYRRDVDDPESGIVLHRLSMPITSGLSGPIATGE